MELLKRPYELSVWDQIPEEKKIAIIGSDTMSSPIRAVDPILTRKTNGEVKLSFKMYTKFFDEYQGDFIENPLISLLMVERLIKLKYDDEWYDLVIKNRQESSDQKMYTYTASSLHIEELSKNGFNLEFKTDLENNQGTIFELGDRIVDGTEWQIDKEASDICRAYSDDQLVVLQYTGTSDFKCWDMLELEQTDENAYYIKSEDYFYTFYSIYKNFKSSKALRPELQILYINNYQKEDLDNYVLNNEYFDSEGIIVQKDSRNNIIFTNIDIYIESSYISENVKISNYRGKKLVKQQKTRYNSVLDKYVKIYNKGAVEGYTTTEYTSPTFVQNLLVNTKDFTNTSGWYGMPNSNKKIANIELDIYPSITNTKDITEKFTSRLKFTATEDNQIVYNTGIRSNITKIDKISKNDKYTLRYKFKKSDNSLIEGKPSIINFQITLSGKVKGKDEEGKEVYYFSISEPGKQTKNGYYESEVTSNFSITNEDIKNLQFEIEISTSNSPIYLEDIEFFPKVYGKLNGISNQQIYPGDIPDNEPIEKQFLYSVEKNKDKTDPEKYEYLSSSIAHFPVYNSNDGYPKIASIEKSESNRFNLIQELCETFQCWAKFIIDHDENGKIKEDIKQKDENGNIKIIKARRIVFKEYIGDIKWNGFIYGINLKSIQRTIDSDQIVTKTIVKANSNQHGENGFCSIERAEDNITGQNYILNFDYYINQNLLSREILNKDLYDSFYEYEDGSKDGGFYNLIKQKSTERDQIIKERTAFSASYLEGISQFEVAKEAKDAADKEYNDALQEYKQYTDLNYPNIPEKSLNSANEINDKKIIEYFAKIERIKNVQKKAEENYNKYKNYTEDFYNAKLKEYETRVENLGIEKLNNDFFNKYKNFIKEGTWNSEEYWDDNLYYMDALDVSRTSSKPKVTYTINVIDVTPLPGYEGYKVELGDKTFIEDVEFFGYTYFISSDKSLSYKKPYREEIVVTEIEEHLDQPASNQIKVQNYKNQFDDLFQRITAATQSLQYASGGYNRASAAFNNNGTIDGNILQSSLLQYGITFLNPQNEGVVWDKNGIKVIDRKNTNRIIKLADGKISFTNNGGQSWDTSIGADGINANMLSSGSIDTNKIIIGNSENYSFRWDQNGINAYFKNKNDDTKGYNYGKFTRFDSYGFYGYSKGENFIPNDINDIKSNADFGLTWDGFFLKSDHNNGYVEIDKTNDFRVMTIVTENGKTIEKERIKIGLLDEKSLYGIRINDNDENPVMWTDSKGNLTVSGTITANDGYIGKWEIVNGNLSSVDESTKQGIILDANLSQIYSQQYKDSNGSDGWSISNDIATFNNITLRGSLKCAVLEYGEVQAVGGILMIRPSTTIKDYTFLENDNNFYYYTKPSLTQPDVIYNSKTMGYKLLELEVENSSLFEKGDYIKIASEVGEDLIQEDKNNNGEIYKVLYSGINTNLLECFNILYKDKIIKVENEEGKQIEETIKVKVIILSLKDIPEDTPNFSGTSISGIKSLPLRGMGLIDLGIPGYSIGIGLNSSDNNAMVQQTAMSMFTLEERRSSITGELWRYLQPHIILGKIPEDSIYDESLRGKYGLYADAAQITGIIRAKALFLGDSNTNVFEDNGKIDTSLLNKDFIEIDKQYGIEGEESTSFELSTDGLLIANNAIIKGTIYANYGTIGGFNITKNYIQSTDQIVGMSGTSSDWAFWAGRDSSTSIASFQVKQDGTLKATKAIISGSITATEGTIGGWTIDKNKIYGGDGTEVKTAVIQLPRKSITWVFAAGGTKHSSYEDCPFRVDKNGNLVATSATIAGGTIGDFILEQQTITISIAGKEITFGPYFVLTSKSNKFKICAEGFNAGLFKNYLSCYDAEGNLDCFLAQYLDDIDENGEMTESHSAFSVSQLYADTFQLTTGEIGTITSTPTFSSGLDVNGITITGTTITIPAIGTLKILSIDGGIETSLGATFGGNVDLSGTLTINEGLDVNGVSVVGGTYKDKDYCLTVTPRLRVKTDTYGYVLLSSSSTNTQGGIYFNSSDNIIYGHIRSGTNGRLEINARGSSGTPGGGTGDLYGNWNLNNASISTSSDINLKNSIEILSDDYSKLFDNLQTVRYKYNNGTSNRYHTGFISQQVGQSITDSGLTTQDFAGFVKDCEKEINPETGEEEIIERYYLRYEEFIALNTNEIQKLKKRVAILEEELSKLKQQLS